MMPVYVFLLVFAFLMGVTISATHCMDWYAMVFIGCFGLMITFCIALWITPNRRKDDKPWDYIDRRGKD